MRSSRARAERKFDCADAGRVLGQMGWLRQVLYMPHFSNPLNNHRDASAYVAAPDPEGAYNRGAAGLPEASEAHGSPLLGCFNSGYKHSPDALDMWAEVRKTDFFHVDCVDEERIFPV